MNRRIRRHGERGFTLLEMVVVIVIIGFLAALVAPSMFERASEAKQKSAATQIEMLSTSLETYRLDNNYFPTTEQGLKALHLKPTTQPVPSNWKGPYLKKSPPPDPWGREYLYVSPGEVNKNSYDLSSLGRDGKEGGEGEDADLKSWENLPR